MADSKVITEAIADVLKEWGDERIKNAQTILRNKDAVASSILLQSITNFGVSINGNTISIPFGFIDAKGDKQKASKYWQYVDEGVAGIGGGNKSALTTGRFKYKNNGKRIPAKPIQEWMTAKGVNPPADFMPKVKLLQRVEGWSYVLARSIKKTGIGKTMFWSDTFNEKAYKDLADRIAKKIGGEYTIQLKGI